MVVTKNILDIMPAKAPVKKDLPVRGADGADGFYAKLDKAANAIESKKQDRPIVEDKKDSQTAVDNKKEPEVKDSTELTEDTQEAEGEDTPVAKRLPDVFASIPIFSSELITMQAVENGGEAMVNQEFTGNIAVVQDADVPVDTTINPLLESKTEIPVNPETKVSQPKVNSDFSNIVAELNLNAEGETTEPQENQGIKNLQDLPETKSQPQQTQTVEKPKAEVLSQMLEVKGPDVEVKAEIPKDTVKAETPKDTANTEISKDTTKTVEQSKSDVFKMAGDSKTADFVKQAMQEVEAVMKQDNLTAKKSTDTTSKVSEQVADVGAVVEESAGAMKQDDGEADSSAKQKEAPLTNTQQPMTASVAKDGKIDFKMSMQELQPEQQAQQKQNVETQIIDQVRSMVTKEKTEFVLQLKPEHLGGLSIMLAAEEKGLVAKMMTSSKDVHMMLQNDMTQIQESLRERGINVVQMEVIYDQMASATGKQDTNNGQGWGQNQGSRGSHGGLPEDVIDSNMTLKYDELSNYDVLAEQGGSVEFSA